MITKHRRIYTDPITGNRSYVWFKSANNKKENICKLKFLNEFTYLYKTRNLDIEYYREFNANSFFRAFETITHLDVGMDCAYNLKPSEVDIKYNFFNYLVPMINMLL